MNHRICDVKIGEHDTSICGKVAYDQVAIKKNYWFGEKIIKIDVCTEHFIQINKILGFENEYASRRYANNQWRNRD